MIPARNTHTNPRATTHANPRAAGHTNPRPLGAPRAHQPAGIGTAPIDWEKLIKEANGPFGPGGPQGPNGPGGNGGPIYQAPSGQKPAPTTPERPATPPYGGGGPAPSYQFANDAVSLSPEAEGQDDDSFVNPFAAWDA